VRIGSLQESGLNRPDLLGILGRVVLYNVAFMSFTDQVSDKETGILTCVYAWHSIR